jgi:hypothetical protein
MKRSPMKRKRPYVDPLEKKIRDSAEGEACTLRFDTVCNGNPLTTVYCHSNLLKDGKGMGLKAKTGAYGCFDCHNVLDYRAARPSHMSYDEMISIFENACAETRRRLIKKGIISEDPTQGTGNRSSGEEGG